MISINSLVVRCGTECAETSGGRKSDDQRAVSPVAMALGHQDSTVAGPVFSVTSEIWGTSGLVAPASPQDPACAGEAVGRVHPAVFVSVVDSNYPCCVSWVD